jgi:rod shape-determining protein MreD
MKTEYRRYFLYAGFLFFLVVLQILLNNFLTIKGVTPDFVLIGVVYIALKEGQISGAVAGFAAGLLLDLYFGESIGISALAKTLSGFIAGYFFDAEKAELLIRSSKSLLIMLVVSLVHNCIYLIAYFRGFNFDIIQLVFLQIFGKTLFTFTFAFSTYLVYIRTGTRLKV